MHPQPKVKDVDESQGEDEVFHQDSGSDDDVEVLSSCCAKDFRSKRSLPSSRSSPSKSSTAGSTSLIKSTRRTSKAVIEAEDEDEEIRPPRIPPALVLVPADSVDCSQPCQNSTIEAMVFHNPLIQTCCPASSNLSISAQEFQPRVQSETLAAGETKPPPGFLAFNNRHEASSCLSHQYQAPLSFPPQPLYQPVYQANSQPYQFVQVNSLTIYA